MLAIEANVCVLACYRACVLVIEANVCVCVSML